MLWQVRLTLPQGCVSPRRVGGKPVGHTTAWWEKPWETLGGLVEPTADQKPHQTVYEPRPAEQSQARTIKTGWMWTIGLGINSGSTLGGLAFRPDHMWQ